MACFRCGKSQAKLDTIMFSALTAALNNIAMPPNPYSSFMPCYVC